MREQSLLAEGGRAAADGGRAAANGGRAAADEGRAAADGGRAAAGLESPGITSSRPLVVLAYSGGLDTSCILVWLREQGYDTVAYLANVGQEEDFEAAKAKALKLGAVEVIVEDLRLQLVQDFAFASVCGQCQYEGRYLLGTALARPCIVQGLVRVAKERGAGYIAHGATGKGNDQVRFEFGCAALMPEVKVLAPWRDPAFYERFSGRQDLFKYAKERGIPLPVTPKTPWSIDANIIHVSYESGVLEDPAAPAPPGLCEMTTDPVTAPDQPQLITLDFEKGIPVGVTTDDTAVTGALDVFLAVNAAGAKHGVGRVDIVENRFLGLKSRGVYETPGLTLLLTAHAELESVCMDREVRRVKEKLGAAMAEQIYNGLWFSPECCYTRQCVMLSQEHVTGSVTLRLYKGGVSTVSRSGHPSCSLYNARLVSMEQHGGFEPTHATGFIAVHGMRLREYWGARRRAVGGEGEKDGGATVSVNTQEGQH